MGKNGDSLFFIAIEVVDDKLTLRWALPRHMSADVFFFFSSVFVILFNVFAS